MKPFNPACAEFGHTFYAPLLLAIVSAIGLLSALLGDGIWDMLSWMALTTPLAVIIWYVTRSGARVRGR